MDLDRNPMHVVRWFGGTHELEQHHSIDSNIDASIDILPFRAFTPPTHVAHTAMISVFKDGSCPPREGDRFCIARLPTAAAAMIRY
mmetsp:Transcript_24846/g.69112  ORF Transcript_24846/g.69112 Transcript_24846/m.69112 type:complete len:86 (+) Transcript_24846:854-1111(+)